MTKVFLYDPPSLSKEAHRVLVRKQYVLLELTSKPAFFWEVLDRLQKGDVFALLSHGNKNGPLPVRGDDGEDVDLDRFSKILAEKKITLYLLSCYTGVDPCLSKLLSRKVEFVAPIGMAVFATIGDESIQVYSKTGEEFMGWAGSKGLTPTRLKAALSLP